ncbi:hypothetical protein AMELA_G00009090 [Ameiurus melas]|uniref:Uncharacterized protein n=1 Tax=Ameiurus melas TaxID=219545 RepID=A0A7J6BG63_AMEME|nr:hypothetical protein AMELA_G00009090 [Ameiurus melas]
MEETEERFFISSMSLRVWHETMGEQPEFTSILRDSQQEFDRHLEVSVVKGNPDVLPSRKPACRTAPGDSGGEEKVSKWISDRGWRINIPRAAQFINEWEPPGSVVTASEEHSNPDDQSVSARISACLPDISVWMKEHHLELNLAKSELLVIPA